MMKISGISAKIKCRSSAIKIEKNAKGYQMAYDRTSAEKQSKIHCRTKVALIHSVDSYRLAEEINIQAKKKKYHCSDPCGSEYCA